jgi:hypothetical protein
MRIHLRLGVAVLIVLAGVTTAAGQEPEAVAKLIGQLCAADFRTRQDASNSLAKMGSPALPALRKALTSDVELEAKRRIEHVIARIENTILQTEEKLWQEFDAPRRGIRDRLVRILTRNPTLDDQKTTVALYLLTIGRAPTQEEAKQAGKQLAAADGKRAGILQLARSLVKAKEFNADLAGVNTRLLKLQADLSGDTEVAQQLARLNSAEFQKLINETAAGTAKVFPADPPFVQAAFLLTLSRFPTDRETREFTAHLERTKNRTTATADGFWALLNTREFVLVK